MSARYLNRNQYGLFLSFVLLYVFAVTYVTAQPNPDFVNALWVSQEHNLLKISSATGQSLFQIKIKAEVQRVEVDKFRARVWLVNEETLQAFDFSGKPLRSFPLATLLQLDESGNPEPHQNKYKELQLNIDDKDGSVWLYQKKTLWHVTAEGKLLHVFSLNNKIESIALIPAAEHVWLASKKTIRVYDIKSGQLIRVQNAIVKNEIKALAYDKALNEVWLAGKKSLMRLTTDGEQTYQQDFKHIEAIQPDERGKLWLASEDTLYYLDASGSLQFQLTPFSGEKENEIKKLVLEATDQSVWVAGEHALVHIDNQGLIKQRIQLKGEIEDAAIYSDLIAPLLNFKLPAQFSILNTATPALMLQYSDNGIGTDISSLSIQQDGLDLSVNCQHAANASTCYPLDPLAEGLVNLSATLKDYVGNTSEKATTSFTVDTIAPQITVSSHWNGAYVNQSAQAFSGALSEFAALQINGNPVSLGLNNLFSYPVLLLEGQNNFLFKAQDEATNESTLPFVLNLDTVPPVAADTGKINIADVDNGQTVITGQPGSVEANATVEVTNLSTNVVTTIQANDDGSFSLEVEASAGDKIKVIVIDKAGNRSATSEMKIPLPLSITITSPVDLTTIEGDTVNIEGSFKGPANTGITVNGLPAEVSPEGLFVFNAVVLSPGPNVLDIVLTTLSGDSVSKSITVTSNGLSQPFNFEPDFNSGPAPFAVGFEFSWNSNETISKIEMDYEGDGIIDYTTNAEQESFPVTYSQPGVFHPTITITTASATYKKQVTILVQSRESMIALFTSAWDGMNKALVQGDLVAALSYLDNFGQKQYGPVFEVLKDKMPQIVQSYSRPQGVLITRNIGELAINRLYQGKNRIYFIYFMRNRNGLWKLHNM